MAKAPGADRALLKRSFGSIGQTELAICRKRLSGNTPVIIDKSDCDLPYLLETTSAFPYTGNGFRVVAGKHLINNPDFDALWAANGAGRCNPDGVPRLYLSFGEEYGARRVQLLSDEIRTRP